MITTTTAISGGLYDAAQWFGQQHHIDSSDIIQEDRRDEILTELHTESVYWVRTDDEAIVQTDKGRCLIHTREDGVVVFTYAPFGRSYTEIFWMNKHSVASLAKRISEIATKVTSYEHLFFGRLPVDDNPSNDESYIKACIEAERMNEQALTVEHELDPRDYIDQ